MKYLFDSGLIILFAYVVAFSLGLLLIWRGDRPEKPKLITKTEKLKEEQ